MRLAKMLAALIDEHGRVQVPGLLRRRAAADRSRAQAICVAAVQRSASSRSRLASSGRRRRGYTTLERRWARPTFDINGLTSGYQGEGAKTVLPAKASAKFSFRLVPNQDPKKIAKSLEKKLRELLPAGHQDGIDRSHGAPGVVVPLESPYMAAAAKAIEHGFGKAPVFIREGGSIPIVTTFREQLGVDTLLLGWGLDDDNTHSPNEKFCLADFHRGIKASARLWQELADDQDRNNSHAKDAKTAKESCSIANLLLRMRSWSRRTAPTRGEGGRRSARQLWKAERKALQAKIDELNRRPTR